MAILVCSAGALWANDPWIGTGGSSPWVGEGRVPNVISRSGSIADGQWSEMYIEPNQVLWQEVSFDLRVSSEENYDMLIFLVDGVEKGRWSGTVGWTTVKYALEYGTNRLSWVYEKDGSSRSGSDCAWVDNIVITEMLPISMTYVEGGSFQMGYASGDSDESPVHTVRVGSFYIGTFEVTQDIYEKIMGSNPSNWKGARRPVERVSWYEAVAFCNALSRREGREEAYTINGKNVSCDWESTGYRLPTEAEWEYAARGGVESLGYSYAGSNIVNDVAWSRGNSGGYTHEVGGKAANELGLYDLSGNVREWCWDVYGSTYYSRSLTGNPTGPTSGSSRVLRGGGWLNLEQYVRVTNREYGMPDFIDSKRGFRVLVPAEW